MDLLKSINIFREVCKQMSFSLAAEKLNLVPSAVSRQVNELEKYLGVRLLERTTRSISLTDSGQRHLKKMEKISQLAQELVSFSTDQKDLNGHIRITAPAALGSYYLSSIFSEFLQTYPGVTISTTFVIREVNLIEEGFDFAVRVGELADYNLISKLIGVFPVALVASPGYLEKNGVPEYPEDLVNHNCLINTQFHTPRRWRFEVEQRPLFVKVNGQFEANDDLMLLSLACKGNGIANLPQFLVQQSLNNGELVSLLNDYMPKPSPVSVVYPSRHHLSDIKKQMIKYLLSRKYPTDHI